MLELSSFQLETIETFHPRIAVILNITPDHLDRHGSFENYREAKERIFLNQSADDFLILNADDETAARSVVRAHSQVFWFSRTRVIKQGAFVHEGSILFRRAELEKPEPILPIAEIPIRGAHNLENVLAAVTAARLAGVPAEVIRAGVAGFAAVEHRLEFVAQIHGVDYYNDSKATNVDAAAKAILSFEHGVHLILGGKDKDSDYRTLRPLLERRVHTVYVIGAAAEKIENHLRGAATLRRAGTLANALEQASAAAEPGDTVLLAPACSSFDQFHSYEDRGTQFKQKVHALEHQAAPQGA